MATTVGSRVTTLQLGVLDEATVYQKPAVTIQGQTYPVQTVKDAILILKTAPGTAVKTPLKQAGNPLGLLSLTTLTEGSLFDEVPPDGLKPAKGKTRRHVINRLEKLLDGSQLKANVPVGTVIKVKEPDSPPQITFKGDAAATVKTEPVQLIDLATAMVVADDESMPPDDEEDCEEVDIFLPKCAYGVAGCGCSPQASKPAMKQTEYQLPLIQPAPPTPPTYTKKGIFEYNDETAYAKMPIKGIRTMLGNGDFQLIFAKVREYTDGVMPSNSNCNDYTWDEQSEWANAFYNGDLHTCWTIENTKGSVHHDHPGGPAHAATKHLIWEPGTHGELPVGILPPGNWPGQQHLIPSVVDNYLVAAKMIRPQALHTGLKQAWVIAHITGNKSRVDDLSERACKQARYIQSDPCTHTDGYLTDVPPLDQLIAAGNPPRYWPIDRVHEYLTKYPNSEPASTFYAWKIKAVEAHLDEQRLKEARKNLALQLTAAPDQPKLSGYHTKQVLLDQDNRRWLFKPAAEGRRFRADVEHHAHRLARRWGYRTAPSQLIEHDGNFGQLQRLFDLAHDLAGWTGKDLLKLTLEQLAQLTREHVLDWAIDNDDTHGENIVATTGGELIGIDKGRAWRYYGSWNGLTGDARANSNCQLIYTVLYDAIAAGLFDQRIVDHLYRDAIAQAHRMTALPDDELRAIITAAQEHRPHYNPSSYQKPHPAAPADLTQLLDAAVARKNNLPADIQQLWTNVYQRAGWTLPDPTTPHPPGLNAQGHRLHADLHSTDLHDAITRTSSYGTATFVAGEHIEDAHILIWREKHATKGMQLRGHFKLRAGTEFEAVRTYCKSRSNCTVEELVGPNGEPFNDEYVAIHKIISEFATKINRDFGDTAQKCFPIIDGLKVKLRARLQELQAVGYNSSPEIERLAEKRIVRTYISYCLRLLEATQFPYVTFMPFEMPAMNFNRPKPKPEDETLKVEKVQCRRPRSGTGEDPKFDNGELVVGEASDITDTYNNSRGQGGYMYLVTLDTGETIEFRADEADGVLLAAHGTLEFTAPADDIPTAMQRITKQLADMGCPLQPATNQDLELFYWRHLAGILGDRVDSKRNSYTDYIPFWKAVDAINKDTVEQELTGLRAAFATLTSTEQISQFTAAAGHLPRFMHLNLHHPTAPSGKPYWERFDVTAADWNSKGIPVVQYRSGPIRAAMTGACLSTSARTRALGIWRNGMSSPADLSYGSGTFVFIRQNQVDPKTYRSCGLLFNQRVLGRTNNYAFPGDGYGRITSRRALSHWNFHEATGHLGGANELMVKDALSILDDVELMIFNSSSHLKATIDHYTKLGITEIRGLPLRWRMRLADDWATTQLMLQVIQERLGDQ